MTQISQLLGGRYAYGTQFDGQNFNLLHGGSTSGPLTDYKLGPSSPVDKSAVVGAWSIGQVDNRAVVVYTYGSFSYSYSISPKPTGQNPPPLQAYTFCQRAGSAPNNVGQALNVTVTTVGQVRP